MQCFLPSPTLQFYSFITCHKVWNIPLPCLGWLSWCCPLGILCPPYWQDSMRSTEMETPLALCSTAQQQLKHQCIINTVLLKPNYSIISDNIKKIISVSAETRTEGDSWGHIHRWWPHYLKYHRYWYFFFFEKKSTCILEKKEKTKKEQFIHILLANVWSIRGFMQFVCFKSNQISVSVDLLNLSENSWINTKSLYFS